MATAFECVRPAGTARDPLQTIAPAVCLLLMGNPKLIDRSKTLQELEGADWGSPETAETATIGRVLTLRRKPLEELSNGEVRLAITHQVGFPIVLELAIERLRPNPLLEADFYPGDVLAALVRLDEQDWQDRNDLREALAELFRQAMAQSSGEADVFRDSLQIPLSDGRAN